MLSLLVILFSMKLLLHFQLPPTNYFYNTSEECHEIGPFRFDNLIIIIIIFQIRWVVESANARIKAWKYLDHVLPTCQVPYIGEYVKIVCAISNKYLPPLSVSKSAEDDFQVAAQMRQLSSQVNTLKTYVEENKLERGTVKWLAVDDGDFEENLEG